MYLVGMALLAQTRFRRVRTHVPASLRVRKSALGKILSLWREGRHEPYGRLEGYAGTRSSRYTWGAGGKEFEEETGHVKFGVRDYDPMTALWVSQDPKAQFASLYVTGANPLNHFDPDGQYYSDANSCADDASAAIGFYQGEISSPDHQAFQRGMSQLDFQLPSLEDLSSKASLTGNEWGRWSSGTQHFSSFTSNDPYFVHRTEGPDGVRTSNSFAHAHFRQPPSGRIGMYQGFSVGDLGAIVPGLGAQGASSIWVTEVGTGAVYYSDPKLIRSKDRTFDYVYLGDWVMRRAFVHGGNPGVMFGQ